MVSFLARLRRWIRRRDRRWITDTAQRDRHAALVRERLRIPKDDTGRSSE